MNAPPEKMTELVNLLTLAGQLEPPKYTPEYLQNNTVQCSCGKVRVITPDMFFATGLVLKDGTRVMALEHLCPSCVQAYHGTARLVCLRCRPRRVIARIAPHRDPKSGLEFKLDRCYHATGCPACEPTGKSQMVEQAVMLANRVK